jgi:hypothetical protein
MRYWLVLGFLLGACTPEIAPGAYNCGPNGLCPSGTVCNPADATCVLKNSVQPFACSPVTTDDAPETGTPLGSFACVSPPTVEDGCLINGDAGDWFQFDTPGNCTTVKVVARVTFPVAFENLGLEFSDGSLPQSVDTPCDGAGSDAAQVTRCFEKTLTPGQHYAIAVRTNGEGDCNGSCTFNSYSLSVQLATP